MVFLNMSGELTPQGSIVFSYVSCLSAILCVLPALFCVVLMCLVLAIFPLTKCSQAILLSWR